MPRSVFSDGYKSMLDVLVAARKEAGVTQVELAKRLGKPQPFISYFERGERRIDLIEFCAIAKAMGYEPEVLFKRVLAVLPERLEI
jgi:transcriptional regulator with XRE-family HTH domain